MSPPGKKSGLTTNEMARLVADLIENHSQLSGLYHVAGPAISKYDLLSLVRDAFGLNVEIIPADEFVLDRTLDASRFRAATGYKLPSWAAMVETMAADPTPYAEWRR